MEQLRHIGKRGPHLFRLRPRERVAPAADSAIAAGVVAVPMGAQIREDRGSRGLVRGDAEMGGDAWDPPSKGKTRSRNPSNRQQPTDDGTGATS
jgi:hypothetical protein